jgi:hypothetical protein
MPTSTYEPIATYTLPDSTTNSFAFTIIPTTFQHLVLVVNFSATQDARVVRLNFNNDTGPNYEMMGFGGNSGTINDSEGFLLDAITSPVLSGTTTTQYLPTIFNIFNYKSTNQYKQLTFRGAGQTETNYFGAVWRDLAAINRIDISIQDPSPKLFKITSMATLYGIRS